MNRPTPLSDPTASSFMLNRRDIFFATAAFGMLAVPACSHAQSTVTLPTLIRQPLLRRFYSALPHGWRFAPDGVAGYNIGHFRLVEQQWVGADLITCWVASGREDLRQLGWKALDVGLSYQQPDGGFGRYGYFHSNSMLLDGVARACVLDPAGATAGRLDALRRGCEWMLVPKNLATGKSQNAPYTHRRYLLAEMFAEAGVALGDKSYRDIAADFASDGLSLQKENGCNPEMGGCDASYQTVGILLAMRYYCFASATMQSQLRRMVSKAVEWELPLISPQGNVSIAGSTRVGKEQVFGNTKHIDGPTVFQALVYANAVMPHPTWVEAARKVAANYNIPI